MESLPALDRGRGVAGALAVLQRVADAQGGVDSATHYMDGTVVRAPQHVAGAVGGQQHEGLGRSRGGFSTRVHLRAEGGGRPMTFVLSGVERHESRYVVALLQTGHVRWQGRGRPRVRSSGTRGYNYPTVCRRPARRVERLVSQLKRYRRGPPGTRSVPRTSSPC